MRDRASTNGGNLGLIAAGVLMALIAAALFVWLRYASLERVGARLTEYGSGLVERSLPVPPSPGPERRVHAAAPAVPASQTRRAP